MGFIMSSSYRNPGENPTRQGRTLEEAIVYLKNKLDVLQAEETSLEAEIDSSRASRSQTTRLQSVQRDIDIYQEVLDALNAIPT